MSYKDDPELRKNIATNNARRMSSASTIHAVVPREGSVMVSRAAASQFVAGQCAAFMAGQHDRCNGKPRSAWTSRKPSCLSARYVA